MDNNTKLKETSGNVKFDSKLVAFLYLLIRDHLPAGEVQGIILKIETEDSNLWEYSNGYLANYAKYLENELNE